MSSPADFDSEETFWFGLSAFLPCHVEGDEERDVFVNLPFLVAEEMRDCSGYGVEMVQGRDLAASNYLTNTTLRLSRCAKTKKSKSISLDILPELPIDILLEVFGHLHAIDLIHLSRSTKSLRQLLLSSDCDIVWKEALSNDDTIPRCPDGWRERRWATFLFGCNRCENCAKSGAMPDFTFRQRLCTPCLNMRIRTSPAFVVGIQLQTSALLPSTRRRYGGQMFGWNNSPAFLRHAYQTVCRNVFAFKEDIRKGTPGAQDALKKYLDAQQASTTSLYEFADDCYGWVSQVNDITEVHEDLLFKNLTRRVKSHLIRDGHRVDDVTRAIENSGDLDRAVKLYIPRSTRRLSLHRWRQVRSHIESIVLVERERRLEEEREQLIESRKAVVQEAFQAYKKKALPSTWAYWPPMHTVTSWDEFSTLINSPGDDALEISACADALKNVPQRLEDWTKENMVHLASLLPSYTHVSRTSTPDLTRLDLATSVFRCPAYYLRPLSGGRCLIGWEEAGAHLQCKGLVKWPGLWFNRRGNEAASSLVSLAGIDPSTTARVFDGHNLRFVCASCIPGARGRFVWTWRECVHHFIVMEHDVGHATPAWELLAPEITQVIQACENVDYLVADKAWSCNHCGEHFDSFVKRREAIQHVKTAHDLQLPVENVDFVHIASAPRTVRVASRFNEDAVYLCPRCPVSGLRPRRLFTVLQLKRHTRDKHGREPSEVTQFAPIPAILRIWPPVSLGDSSSPTL